MNRWTVRARHGRFARLCPECDGQGLMNALAACRECGGTGVVETPEPSAQVDPVTALAVVFGRRVREARKAHGWTQMELAAKSGVGQETVSACERGVSEPVLGNAVSLAAALGVSLDALTAPGGAR